MTGLANWGDVPGWIQAVASFTALVAALFAVVVARRTFQNELNRNVQAEKVQQDREEFARRAQAALVSAWWAAESGDDRHGMSRGSWGAFLRNGSEAPVYKVSVAIEGSPGELWRSLCLPVLPPTSGPRFISAWSGDDDDPDSAAVSVRFTDAGGTRWSRDRYGALTQLHNGFEVWTAPEFATVLESFSTEFLAAYGVRTRLDSTVIADELRERFLAGNDDGPDILIAPHDWLPELTKSRTVSPVMLTAEQLARFRGHEWLLESLTIGDQLWGVPSSLDGVGLYRNLDLLPGKFERLEDLLEAAVALRAAGKVDFPLAMKIGPLGTPFLLCPLISSSGGRLMETLSAGDVLDVSGLWSDETQASFDWLGQLAVTKVLSPLAVDGEQCFLEGRAALLVATSGMVTRARARHMRFDVSPVLGLGGRAAGSGFSSVVSFFIRRNGRGAQTALDLAPDYLTRTHVLQAISQDNHLVPWGFEARDPGLRAFQAICERDPATPSDPFMREVWRSFGKAHLQMLAGHDAETVCAGLQRALG